MSIAIERILVPLDFSEPSSRALEVAIELALRFRAELTLLHVHQLPAYIFPDGVMPVAPELMQEIQRSILAELDRVAEQVRAAEVPVQLRVALGPTFAEIVRMAREEEFDLIVIGTHGRGGISHALLGSVAEKVVRKAPCPVLTVRPEGHLFVRP